MVVERKIDYVMDAIVSRRATIVEAHLELGMPRTTAKAKAKLVPVLDDLKEAVENGTRRTFSKTEAAKWIGVSRRTFTYWVKRERVALTPDGRVTLADMRIHGGFPA